MDDELRSKPGVTSRFLHCLKVRYQYYLDRLTPHTTIRWVIALISFLFFASRIFLLQRFYFVALVASLWYIIRFRRFLTPSINPSLEFEDGDDGPVLPSKAKDEFRPFVRQLPELSFWHSFMAATIIGTTCTFFEFLNIQNFLPWPVHLIYVIIVAFVMLKPQIRHMIKYRYIPFTVGKPRMAGKEDTGKVVVG